MELETEVKKLSGQQNIQQRIHHHAKIKVIIGQIKSLLHISATYNIPHNNLQFFMT